MENLVNKYIFTNWKHNSGSEFKWLRRINRQTSTQYISDCQRSLHTNAKGNIIEKNNEYFKSSLKSCSTRFKINKSNKLIEIRGIRANTNGVNVVTIVEDFNTLDCNYSYEVFLQEIEKYGDDRYKVHVIPIKKIGELWDINKYTRFSETHIRGYQMKANDSTMLSFGESQYFRFT